MQCLEPRFTKHNSTINLRLCKSRLSFLGRMALQLGKIGKGSHLSLWPRLRWLQRARGLWYSVKRCLCVQLRSSILNRVADILVEEGDLSNHHQVSMADMICKYDHNHVTLVIYQRDDTQFLTSISYLSLSIIKLS